MKPLFLLSALIIVLFGLSGCNDSSDSTQTAKVSFSIADAPVDSVKAVYVTFESITLKSFSGDASDEEGGSKSQTIDITDDEGFASRMRINLMDYQDGDRKLIINGAEVIVGDYSLILNTYGCAQSADGTGSTVHCSVVEDDGSIKPLKTPSNKLKLGKFTVSQEGNQAYTIEFNLRSSLVNNGGGDNYNLKPHGIHIVDNAIVGSISGTVETILFAADGCPADRGNALYLYQGWHSTAGVLSMTLGDEFDPEIDTDVPGNVLMPYASTLLEHDGVDGSVDYVFGNLAAGQYTLAFSCDDAGVDQSGAAIEGDHPEFYNEILIANPVSKWTELTVSAGANTSHDFTEVDEVE